ncbi:hypothetical protein RP15_gp141 [Staphylococcus phage vB_Sau-RP15]|nr:hypothetical protein RP15_gp141 [Staphylococcus phage vB_Sau-RP15]
MDDRELLTLYKGILNYINKNDDSLLNQNKLLVIKKHEHNLRKLYKKLRREKRVNKIKKFTRELPENILYSISLLMSCISYPFYYIESKVEDLYNLYISNRNMRTYRVKTINDLNKYNFKKCITRIRR